MVRGSLQERSRCGKGCSCGRAGPALQVGGGSHRQGSPRVWKRPRADCPLGLQRERLPADTLFVAQGNRFCIYNLQNCLRITGLSSATQLGTVCCSSHRELTQELSLIRFRVGNSRSWSQGAARSPGVSAHFLRVPMPLGRKALARDATAP